MTQEQIKNLIQQSMAAFGPLLIALGYTTAETWGKWTAIALGFSGLIALIWGIVYGMWTNSQTGLVRAMDTLAKDPSSPVQGVILTQTPEGKELASSIPGNTTVAAGTTEATKIANGAM